MCGCHDCFGSEAELLEQEAACRAGSIVIDADDSPSVTDEVTPIDADSSLDRDRALMWVESLSLCTLVLLVEPFPAWRDTTRAAILVGEQLLGFDVLRRTGPDQNHIGVPSRSLRT